MSDDRTPSAGTDTHPALREAIVGCLLGTAVGDALGLPYEGLPPCRLRRMFPDLGRHHFVFGRGMVSDDTEHACLVARAALKARGNPDIFARQLAWGLRRWLLGVPAGVGFATLRACLRLWVGFPPDRSGVRSAGNGPAMRSPLLGVVYGSQPALLLELVERSTRVTHTTPEALAGALIVALAAHVGASGASITPDAFADLIRSRLPAPTLKACAPSLEHACRSAQGGESLSEFAAAIGCASGVSGYVLHTVPCVIQTWLRHQADFAGGIKEVLSAGGDTDTTAAILGAITGAAVGKRGIPPDWLDGIVEWPRSTAWMEALGHALALTLSGRDNVEAPRLFAAGIPVRNLCFTAVVLLHAARRTAPPY